MEGARLHCAIQTKCMAVGCSAERNLDQLREDSNDERGVSVYQELRYRLRNGMEVAVCNDPRRKRPCLFLCSGNKMTKVASFNNEEAAAEFESFIEKAFGIEV